MDKKSVVGKLLAAKEACGKTYDQLADELSVCNVYVAQLFRRQAQLKSSIWIKEPAGSHYGEAMMDIIHEQFGDGIMSAIDFRFSIKKVKGSQGEDRVLMTWNGKFLPHIEQTT